MQDKLAESIAEHKLLEQKRENELRRYHLMPDTKKLGMELSQLGISQEQLPPWLDEKVRGGRSFSVHLSVWQAAVFVHFIHQQPFGEVSVYGVSEWLAQRFKVNPEFPNADKVAVWDFLKRLEAHDFLSYDYQQNFYVNPLKLL